MLSFLLPEAELKGDLLDNTPTHQKFLVSWCGEHRKMLAVSGKHHPELYFALSLTVCWGKQKTNAFQNCELGWVRCVQLMWKCRWGKQFWPFGWKDLNLNIWKKWKLSNNGMMEQHSWYWKCFSLPSRALARKRKEGMLERASSQVPMMNMPAREGDFPLKQWEAGERF